MTQMPRLDFYQQFLDEKTKREMRLKEYRLASRVLGLRIHKGLTEKQAAKLCGLDLQTYLRYEHAQTLGHLDKYSHIIQELEKYNYKKYKN